MAMTWQQRIDNYVKETGYPRSLFIAEDGRVVGTWIMGNSYKVTSGYHGGYPAGYLKRVKALFPDRRQVLHLFSGRVDTAIMPGTTVDNDPALLPDIVDDAQTLTDVPLELFDLIALDPPYSIEDSMHYQGNMVQRKKVIDALGRCAPGTFLVILDQVFWMHRKDTWKLEACIGMVKSTNHRFRMVMVFRRL